MNGAGQNIEQARFPMNLIEGKLWGKITVGGERTWVHKRFHKDVQAADAALG